MTIDTVRGTQLKIEVEDTPGSGTYTHPCLINAKRGFHLEVSLNKIVIPDCDNPDDPAWQQCIKDVLSASIDGAGKLDTASVQDYNDWLADPDPRKVRVKLGTRGYWLGNFHLSKFDVDGDRGQFAECTIALDSDGACPYTATP